MKLEPMKRILVAVDLAEPSDVVIEESVRLAQLLDASIDLVHVREPFVYALAASYGPSPDQERALMGWIDRSLEAAADRVNSAPVACITTSLAGSPATEIVAHAQKTGADLIVVGTHGRGGFAHAMLGSVAERVVQKARRPVLVVPVRKE
jgi:nucleotide-binding universal stress UspA family protein